LLFKKHFYCVNIYSTYFIRKPSWLIYTQGVISLIQNLMESTV